MMMYVWKRMRSKPKKIRILRSKLWNHGLYFLLLLRSPWLCLLLRPSLTNSPIKSVMILLWHVWNLDDIRTIRSSTSRRLFSDKTRLDNTMTLTWEISEWMTPLHYGLPELVPLPDPRSHITWSHLASSEVTFKTKFSPPSSQTSIPQRDSIESSGPCSFANTANRACFACISAT